MSFNTRLTELLKTDPRLVDDEGELLLAAVQDRAWKIDRDLVKLLLSDKEIKAKFFEEIEGHWIFDTNTFLEYISQKNFLDNSYTRFRNRIGLTIGEKYLRERGDVALVWPYKDTVLEGGQTKEEEKRHEIFFNEVLAQDEINRLLDPKALTNFTRYTAKGKQPVKDFKRDENRVIRENLIVKGNNLLALHTLKTQFRGQVKLIYIDPPYNTGTDSFGYNDNFNQSTWLTFMKNRLEVARELLRDDGFIFIQVDDFEDAYLKVLMDEIFGRENFRNKITWKRRGGSANPSNRLNNVTDYILFYSKNEEAEFKHIFSMDDENTQAYMEERFTNKLPDGRKYMLAPIERNAKLGLRNNLRYEYKGYTPKFGWMVKKEKLIEFDKNQRLHWNSENKPNRRVFLDEYQGQPISCLWTDIKVINPMSKERGTFDSGQKPEKLLQRMIEMTTNEGDIVLDFFSGSGTTAAAAMKMGRQFILVEQLDYIESIPLSRMIQVIKGDETGISKDVNWQGGGEFIYCELMKYNEAFMERIQAAKSSKELLKIWQDMAEGSFLNWYVNPEMPEEAIKDFETIGKEENGFEKQKRLLAELLDKNQLYVNLSEINDAQFKVSKEDKALNKAFYGD